MSKIKAINKGYTITVTSWENDGDNYNTKSITVDSEEKAKVWYDMMQLCTSNKLGNSYGGFNKKQEKNAISFIKEHHEILLPDDNIEENEENLKDWFCSLAGTLLGYGEEYDCRVMESCVITHSPEDIFVNEIKF